MKLLPAIDLIDGRCVRLEQGDFDRETAYSDDPAAALASFVRGGAEEAHLVDLDGAKAREPRQHGLFVDLASASPLRLQVAGGFRTRQQVEHALLAGVNRVVIGSLALDSPQSFAAMLSDFGPDRLTLALDVRIEDGMPMVATHGWLTGSGQSLEAVLKAFPLVRHLLVTDISRDGMLEGPNVALMQSVVSRFPTIELQASGGVASLDDLATLRETGTRRAIVGKAIWERRFSVADGVAYARG